MNKNSYDDPIGWVANQIKQLNKLVRIFYENDTSEISSDDYAKIRASLHTAEIAVNELAPKNDISTSGCNGIFTPFEREGKETFEEYFYKSLNPDMSPVGFTEKLDELIQIARERKVIITTNGTDMEIGQAKVLEEYLSTIPPF